MIVSMQVNSAISYLITLRGFHKADSKMREISEPLLLEIEKTPPPRRQAIAWFDAHASSYLTLVTDPPAWNAYRILLHESWYPIAYEYLFGSVNIVPLSSNLVELARDLHARLRHWHAMASKALAGSEPSSTASACESNAGESDAFFTAYQEISASSEGVVAAIKGKLTAPKNRVLYHNLERTIRTFWHVRPEDVTVNHVCHALDLLARSEGGVELDQVSCEAYGIDYSGLSILMKASAARVSDIASGPKVPRIPAPVPQPTANPNDEPEETVSSDGITPAAKVLLQNVGGSAQDAPVLAHRQQGKKRSKRNQRYEGIDKALREIATALPRSHKEVFQHLDNWKVATPNRKPFNSIGEWLEGFHQSPHEASAWLSQAWGRLKLPAFPRGPK